MRNLILFGLLIILLLVVQFASAKTVDEIIEKYIRARGGKDKLTSVKSIYMEGIKEKQGKEMTVRFIKEQDKLSRTEIIAEDESGIVVVTNNEAWTFFPDRNPAVENITTIDLSGLQVEMDITGPLVDYLSKGHKAELLGKEAVEAVSCFKIKLTTSSGKEMIFWIDTSTYMIIQSAVIPVGGGIRTPAFTRYSNYQFVDGIQFAHTHETKVIGSDIENSGGEINFHTIRLNPFVDPAMYHPQ